MGIAPSALVKPNSPIDATLYPSWKKPSKISCARVWCTNEMLKAVFDLRMSRELGFGGADLSIHKITLGSDCKSSMSFLVC